MTQLPPVRPWDDGHRHVWYYFGGMSSCTKCGCVGLPGNKAKRPTTRSILHRNKVLRALEKGENL